MKPDPDPLFEQLGSLPAWDVSEFHADALHRLARAEFERAHATSAPLWDFGALSRVYNRVLEPALLSVFCLGYFAWAVQRAAAVLISL